MNRTLLQRHWISVLSGASIICIAWTASVFANDWASVPPPEQDARIDVDASIGAGGYARGPVKANHTVVVFFDFFCPTCLELRTVLDELHSQVPETRIIERHLPYVLAEPRAWHAAIAAECAAVVDSAGRFRLELARNPDLSRAGTWRVLAAKASIAWTEDLDACAREEWPAGAIANDTAMAHRIGLTAPPAVIIDGILINRGHLKLKDLLARLRQ